MAKKAFKGKSERLVTQTEQQRLVRLERSATNTSERHSAETPEQRRVRLDHKSALQMKDELLRVRNKERPETEGTNKHAYQCSISFQSTPK